MTAGSADYKAAGVDYDALDEGKRMAMARALATSPLLGARGGQALDASRGEPAFAFDFDGRTLAFVMEGLGTKSVIARHMLERHGIDRFADVAYDTVAAILNDLCCVGALPLVVNAYFATGASEWYAQAERSASLLVGWQRACLDAGCVWGGGESPSLSGLVSEQDIELAGAAVGAVPNGRAAILGDDLQPGDEIVLVASSGMHANGASLARLMAGRLPEGYMTDLPSGRTLGEALLDPSAMYVPLVQALLESGLRVSYLSHITGHGLLKLMRPSKPLTYRVHTLPPLPDVLAFLAEQAGLNPHQAYSTFNMGSGYAVYCEPGAGETVVGLARELGLQALVGGSVEDGPRQVIVEPVGVRYTGDELELSASEPPPG
jgi:phosphoribosylformylglycinamidine cyclo-ligase